jgi:hypothetical protein
MMNKLTFATPAVLDFDREEIGNGEGKKIANSCEVSLLKLSSGGGSASVKVYDAQTLAETGPGTLKHALDCSTTDNDNPVIIHPLNFRKGVFVILEQGQGFGAILSYATVVPKPPTPV